MTKAISSPSNTYFKAYQRASALVAALTLSLSQSLYAQTTSLDTGAVDRLKVDDMGAVAVSISGGFTQANADDQCGAGTTATWAGLSSAVSGADTAFLKSVLLAAKSAGSDIEILTEGCATGQLIIREIIVE